jgi:heme/copper-type cytochrome/quinol oxidase subunit 4
VESNFIGDVMVPAYFVVGSLAVLYLAYKFLNGKGPVFRNFGVGLLLTAVAFAVWALAVITKPADLDAITTIGVVPFAVGLLFFLMAGTQKLKAANRSIVMMIGLGYLAVLLFLRAFVYQSHPAFSAKGLFYFHAKPAIIALYIGAFAAALLPAINAVSQQMKDKSLRAVTQLGFTILAIGGIVLVTSYDDSLQTINGWVMGLTFVALLSVYSMKEVK